MPILELYQVELVDDPWFDNASNQKETIELSEKVKTIFFDRRKFKKNDPSALHDSLLLRWAQLEKEEAKRNVLVVTLDRSLPYLLLDPINAPTRPLAITLDTLLQWISPIIFQNDIEDEFAAVFSEAVQYQLLPQENFFEIEDFLVFAEMDWSSEELPAADVEECILYIKKNAPGLDPSNPADREKIYYHMKKFFTDPGRKYKLDIQRLEADAIEYKRKLDKANGTIREKMVRLQGSKRIP